MNRLKELRDGGWMVAVHNDYTLGGQRRTFWLLTKGTRFAKGEAHTDEEALQIVFDQVIYIESEDEPKLETAREALMKIVRSIQRGAPQFRSESPHYVNDVFETAWRALTTIDGKEPGRAP